MSAPIPLFFVAVEVLLLPPGVGVENDGEIVHLTGTPPLAVPEHPEEYLVV
jgi:hypothetical protein